MKYYFEKFAFLAVVISVAFFSRIVYPVFGNLPALSLADSAKTVPGKIDPPLLILPVQAAPGSVAAANADTPATEIPKAGSDTATSAFIRTGNAPAPSIQAHAVLVADLDTGLSFYSANPDKRWPTASITKLMTAAIAFDHGGLDDPITITPEMFSADPQEFSLHVRGSYSGTDLLHAMLMPSSNVAAEAFADAYGRTLFMAAMNARAKEWGMASTYFDDPSGISAANQSTADDMLLLAQKIYAGYPQIFSITRTEQALITDTTSGNKVSLKSINNFAGQPDFIGGKTGHTDQADGNLLSVFNYDGHPLVIVVLGTNNRFNDTQRLYAWFKTNFK